MLRRTALLALLLCGLSRALHAEPAPIPSGTGINIHTWPPWNNRTDFALIREAGFKFVRVDLGWRWTEPQKGRYDFSLADQWLAEADANNLRVMLTLDYNNPLWSGLSDDKFGIRTRENAEAYGRWAAAAAKHFSSRGVIWEIWNEPNNAVFWKPEPNVQHYMTAARMAYKGVREDAGSTDPIIAPASTFSDKNVVDQRTPNNGLTFLRNCFAGGLLHNCDAVCVHTYRPGQHYPTGRPESATEFYNAVRGMMDTFDAQLPIVSGEWGYSRTDVDEATQGKYLARAFLINAMAGVPLSIHYNYSDSGTDPRDREHVFGIVGYTNNPRKLWPAYYAAQAVNRVLNGGKLDDTKVTNQGRDFWLSFTTPDGPVYVAWTIDKPHAIRLPVEAPGGIAVTDFLGKPLPNATTSLTIDDGPKYLRPAK